MDKPIIAELTPLKVKLEKDKTYYWCACGRSSNQPFCDDSHSQTTITPIAFKVEETVEKHICRCKQTSNPPYCDGTHKKL